MAARITNKKRAIELDGLQFINRARKIFPTPSRSLTAWCRLMELHAETIRLTPEAAKMESATCGQILELIEKFRTSDTGINSKDWGLIEKTVRKAMGV